MVHSCECSNNTPSFRIKGRCSDEFSRNIFFADLSEIFYSYGYEHELYPEKIDNKFLIIVKSKVLIKKAIIDDLRVKFPNIYLVNKLFRDTKDYVPRRNSCTLVNKY